MSNSNKEPDMLGLWINFVMVLFVGLCVAAMVLMFVWAFLARFIWMFVNIANFVAVSLLGKSPLFVGYESE